MKKSVIYAVLFKVLLILLPFLLVDKATVVLDWISYIIMVLLILSALVSISTDYQQKFTSKSSVKPKSKVLYSISSDLLLIASWYYIEFYGFVVTYILTKLFMRYNEETYKEQQ